MILWRVMVVFPDTFDDDVIGAHMGVHHALPGRIIGTDVSNSTIGNATVSSESVAVDH